MLGKNALNSLRNLVKNPDILKKEIAKKSR